MDQSINNLTSIKFIEYQTKLQLIICTCIKLIYSSVRYKCLSTDELWLAAATESWPKNSFTKFVKKG